jgi:hypothetical protein
MSSRPDLNKKEDYRNRGVEVLLSGGKAKRTQPFHIRFGKIVSLFKREITIYFEFSIHSRKK